MWDYSLCKWELGFPRDTYVTHQAVLFHLFFIFKVIITELRLNILGLEGNMIFLISTLRTHVFQDLTFRF